MASGEIVRTRVFVAEERVIMSVLSVGFYQLDLSKVILSRHFVVNLCSRKVRALVVVDRVCESADVNTLRGIGRLGLSQGLGRHGVLTAHKPSILKLQ